MGTHARFDPATASAIVAERKASPGALLPILHALQDAFGYVDRAAIPLIAEALNLSRADVHGAISFYHDFRAAPPGRHVLKLCRAEACQARGCEAVVERLADAHGIAPGATTPDGALTVEGVYCLGNCALGPAALFDGEPLGRLDAAAIDALVERASGGSA
ncbi:MAG: formate dehydrogenase subunit gamma [Hyphomicrobiales bacterium]|nr:formate dehydrogenase subunit gamma [Hyphomicrobiales bacterium]